MLVEFGGGVGEGGFASGEGRARVGDGFGLAASRCLRRGKDAVFDEEEAQGVKFCVEPGADGEGEVGFEFVDWGLSWVRGCGL